MGENINSRVPATIEELKDYCYKRGISLFRISFYLGSDHIGPNAYGIYKDFWTNDYIVYHNLEDGSKQILFQGQDEATAVKEIYDCLLKVLQNSEGPDSYDPDDTYENLNANEAYSAPEPSAPDPSALAEDSVLEKINNSEAIYNSILGEPYSSDLFGDSVVDDTKSSDLTEGRGYSRENNNSSAEEEKDKSIPEDSFRFEDVKDLKTGIVFFLYKLSYYVGRFFYYMSMIFFALNRVFINICLYLRQRLTDPKKKDVRTESFKEIVEDIKSSEKIADFEEKDFDDKISFLWATTKYYTSRLFFHISKLSLRFSNYCSDGLTKSYSIVNPGNTDGMIGSGNTVSTADTDNPGNTADADNTAGALSFTLKEDAAPIEEAQNYDQSQVAREYESPKYDLNKIAREYDGTVDEYVPSYNLSEVADDDSIDALTDSLDEDGSSYSDYNDEFDIFDTKKVASIIFSVFMIFVFLIIMLTSGGGSSRSSNYRSGHNSYYNSDYYK